MTSPLARLADTLSLGSLLDAVNAVHGGYELIAHWTQGEFHHDVVLRVREPRGLPGDVLVVATNCNGGVKEVIACAAVPDRGGLWRWRCPDNGAFAGPEPAMRGRAVTVHFFDPCELLLETARSELREELRERDFGGGWRCKALR